MSLLEELIRELEEKPHLARKLVRNSMQLSVLKF